MKKIVLMGNPNVGKSVVFSRLTGANVIASNYPGTTVDFYEGSMRLEGEHVKIIDAPGTYSLKPTNKAEEVSASLFEDAAVHISHTYCNISSVHGADSNDIRNTRPLWNEVYCHGRTAPKGTYSPVVSNPIDCM